LSIINILDYGLKYIPTYNLDNHSFFSQLIFNLENNMLNINRQFFIKKEKIEKSILYDSLRKNNSNCDNSSEISLNNFNLNVLTNSQEDENFSKDESLKNFFILKKKESYMKRLNNIGISEESFKFQLELYKELENIEFGSKNNLSKGELYTIKKFLKDKPFRVVCLDKNVGTGIISNNLYNDLVYETLHNNEIYEEIFENPLEECRNQIEIKLNELALNKSISHKLHNYLKDCPKNLGSFSIYPKIHKKTYGNRPIISYINHFTNNLCFFIDCLIKPYIRNTETFIQDSQHFIQKTKNIKISKDSILAVADFDSLYSNIDHKDLLEKTMEFFKDKLDFTHIKIEGLFIILKMILDNNIFKYKDNYFKQIKGIAMGSKCGPSIANLYVYVYEKKWLTIHRPKFYYRFIDDLSLCVKDRNELESLKNSFGSLKLNIETGDCLPFLDLNISVNKITSFIKYSLYIKPTNTFQYLQINSNHPEHIFRNLVKSLFIRIRRICSEISDFIYFSSIIRKQLLNRGYDKILIDKIFTMVLKLDREELIKYKDKKHIDFEKFFYVKWEFDINILNFKKIAHRAFESFKTEFPLFNNHKLLIINSMQRNLSSIMAHNFPFPCFYKNNYSKCKNKKCNTCKFSQFKDMIYLKEKFILPIVAKSSCNSKDLIYIIFCSYCNFFYIGQTKDLSERIYKHIYDIKNFIPYTERTTSVSVHFNLKRHNFENHFNFFVYRHDIKELEIRLFNESFMINLCKKLNVNLINDHIPIIKKYYNFGIST
jgi:hypothetical protein